MLRRAIANPRSRLLLNRLDERVVPALFTVQTLADSGVGSLRDLIALANLQAGADTIDFKAGLGGQIKLTSGELSITDALTITYPNVNNLDINGNNSSRIFNTSGAPAKTAINFTGFQIRAGNATGKGGGILIGDESVTITNCSVITNYASDNGGGICVLSANGSLKLLNTGVYFNTVSNGKSGGGIEVDAGSSVTIQNSTIRNNSAGINGGGINLDNGGTLLLENSTISANMAGNQGAGFRCFGAGNLTVRGSTLVNNSSGGTGGAVVLVGFTGTLNLQNSTVAYNLASAGAGGGIGQGAGAGVINITSSIVAGNSNALAADISSVNTVNVNYSAIGSASGFTLAGANNLAFGVNLKLNALDDYGGSTETMRPAADSPVINKGANLFGLTTDQRGVSRVVGAAADIGAVETCYTQIVTKTSDAGAGSLRQAVLDANIDADSNVIGFDATVFAGATTIALTGGEITVTDSVSIVGEGAKLTALSGNAANRVFNVNGAKTLYLSALTICQGKGGNGGAVYVPGGGQVNLNACMVRDNQSTYGGAVYFANGLGTSNLTATNTTFANNSATLSGGAIFLGSQMSAALKNCTLSGNSAAANGGAIDLLSFTTTMQIQNCTITKNTASGSGGGGGITQSLGNGAVVIDSSIVSGNVGAGAPDIASAFPVNVNWSAIGSTNGFTLVGTNNLPIASDLKLGSLVDNGGGTKTHMPAFDSPVVHQGSNPAALLTDQRGYSRIYGPGIDMGAVEVLYTSVVAIVRAGPSPTPANTVSWTVTFVDTLANLMPGNFALTGAGADGAYISSVTGAGSMWTVTATTAAEGLLGLSMINAVGVTHQITNLPAAGGAFVIDKLPLSANLAASQPLLNAAQVGANALTLTATYSEPMDQTSTPTFSFPVEGPGLGLQFASGAWLTPTTYAAKYNLLDFDDEVADIDVRISGGKDQAGNTLSFKDAADLFSIDTANPVVLAISRVDADLTNASTVHWSVTFSEPVTGVTANNFLLFNGGLAGSPNITDVSGSGTTWTVTASTGSGAGNLGLYALKTTGVADAAGNPLAALPVSGPAYAVDHVAPALMEINTNVATLTDANIGPAGFQVTVKFSEPMDQTAAPTVNFPVENPAGTLTIASGSWLDAKTFRVNYMVNDLNLELANVDVGVTGAKDIVGNSLAPIVVPDLFSIDMKAPTIASVLVNDGSVQRSAVRSLMVNFAESVQLPGNPADAFRLTGMNGAVALSVDPVSPTQAVLTFSGPNTEFDSLNDGKYVLSVLAMQVTDLAGSPLDGNGDGLGGDDFTFNLHRLFGDADGNGTVNGIDFLAFRLAFLGTGSTFDFNGDGQVNGSDFLQFRLRFLQSV